MKRIIFLHGEFLIGLLISLSLLWPLFAAPFFTHHDDVQVIRLFEMDKCFKDHQIPCRWVPDLGGVYGYPLFNFYAPLAYYLGGLLSILGFDVLLSTKLMIGTGMLLSGVGMYLLAKQFWGDTFGMLTDKFGIHWMVNISSGVQK